MSTALVSYALARLGVESAPPVTRGRIGRVYVLNTDALAGVLAELSTQSSVVIHEGLRSRVVRGATRPTGRVRQLLRRPRLVVCGEVERTELSLANGSAVLDHELGADRVVVRTWSPREGSELDQALWWHGHRVAARALRPAQLD